MGHQVKRILTIGLLAIAVTAYATDSRFRRFPPDLSLSCLLWGICEPPRRLIPIDPWEYYVPRSVGVNLMSWDKSMGAGQEMDWWDVMGPLGTPNWETVEWARDEFGLTAIGLMLRAHPWDNYYENIRKLFRLPGIDIIVFRPEYWGFTDYRCDGSLGVLWVEYPTGPNDNFPWYEWSVFDGLYGYYANQDKTIIVTNIEADWQLRGVGCRDGEHRPEDYEWYMLREFNRRQAAAERAREANPDAALRVDHGIEVNFFGNEDWQDNTILCGIIPHMDSEPDRIGLSLYAMAGDPVEALHYAMECTGLPANRFYISEVGSRRLDRQYDRIYDVTDTLFNEGVSFALVWSLDVLPEDTDWSVVDPYTGTWCGGMDAIHDLNLKWRE
ncbi:hypothetical protein LCGC14_0344650 [marine sediment metagenome]|uniref:Uncharacterized protein n=1 Tax=marine sediment metagenome TaxID=412755 RepID=A0A0F9TIC6_9ZZZZ